MAVEGGVIVPLAALAYARAIDRCQISLAASAVVDSLAGRAFNMALTTGVASDEVRIHADTSASRIDEVFGRVAHAGIVSAVLDVTN